MSLKRVTDKIKKNKPPANRGLILFFVVSFLHFLSLFSIFINPLFLLLVIPEIIFYLFFSNFSVKLLLRILFISSVIFCINLVFYEGKILAEINFIKITKEGLDLSLKRTGLLLLTFLFTYNTVNKKKENFINLILKRKKSNLILDSINFFFEFVEKVPFRPNIDKMLGYFKGIYIKKERKRPSFKKVILYDNLTLLYQIVFFMVLLIILVFLLILH
jgi:hypothetical protein